MSEITNEIKKEKNICHHFSSRCGKDNADGKISIIWRGDQSGRFCQGKSDIQTCSFRLDGNRKRKRYFGYFFCIAV